MHAITPVSRPFLKKILSERELLTSLVEAAIGVASLSHRKQQTKDGKPYLEHHIFPVALDLLINTKELTQTLIAIALLHDVIEDDEEMSVEILSEQFPHEVVSAIKLLTRQPESKGASTSSKLALSKVYMSKLSTAIYEIRLVKLADRMVNLELLDRIKKQQPDVLKRYIQETKELFIPLARHTSPSYLERLTERLSDLERSAAEANDSKAIS